MPTRTIVPDTPYAPRVMERSYAGFDADGTPKPTMDWFNPQWASWFDTIKQNTGQNPVFANSGGARKLPNSPTSMTAPGAPDNTAKSALEALRKLLQGGQ